MSSIGSSALVSVVTGLVEVVGSLERSCPICGAESAGLAAGVVASVAGTDAVNHFFLSVRWGFSHNHSPINEFLYQYSM